MMPWREQLRLLWLPVRFVLWPRNTPLWAQLVMKACQLVMCLGVSLGSAWIVVSSLALAFALGLTIPLP